MFTFGVYKEFIDHSANYLEKKEPFSGVIDYSGEKLYCTEHEDGYLFGDINDKIRMYRNDEIRCTKKG